MKKARLAIIGTGGMGTGHLTQIEKVSNAELAAVCDTDRATADERGKRFSVPAYYTHQDLFKNETLDGIIIATPHYDHTTISIDAFDKGLHVLCEKPVGVHVNDVKKTIAAYEAAKKKDPKLVFSAMFNQRTFGHWQKIKDLIDAGELGRLVRSTWIITNWFRSQTYYDNGGWRATWDGEGGGVLLNQCPHNLDLYQWFVGMPDRVRGFISIAKYHHIEVEDEVTGYFEYKNGMVGHFITTTAETPGTNRLEIVGENGKLVYENGQLIFYRNRGSMLTFIKESKTGFGGMENWECRIPFSNHGGGGHLQIIQNFADAITAGAELIAPGVEGIHSVGLGNAIMLSSFEKRMIDMPVDADAYEKKLKDLIQNSKFQKNVKKTDTDLSGSFNVK